MNFFKDSQCLSIGFMFSILVVINLQWQCMNQSVFKTIPTSIMFSTQFAMTVHEPVSVQDHSNTHYIF